MLDSQDVFAAAKAAILVVENATENVTIRGVKHNYYTLEGAVSEALYRHLNMPFERDLRQAVDRARDEKIHIRFGNIDSRELADEAGDRIEQTKQAEHALTQTERLERLLQDALEDLKRTKEHVCNFGSDDYCTTCELDGPA
jgi:DNA-binding transcriptional regulator GbsR (MarR family)